MHTAEKIICPTYLYQYHQRTVSFHFALALKRSLVSHRADPWFAPSQWRTALLCNDVSYSLGENLESALFTYSGLAPFHQGFFHCNSNLMEFLLCFHTNCNEVIIMKFCKWHGSCAVVVCEKFCRNMIVCNVTSNFHKSLVTWPPPTKYWPHFQMLYF